MNEPKLVLEASDVAGHPLTVGRYLLHRQIARGGMATIHVARLMGDEGFSRIVAAKRLHPEFAEDAEFVAMFLDEARIASKVHHRNVVPVLDVVTAGEEVILVQEYVHGAPLQWLLRSAQQQKGHIPLNIAVSIACQVLSGLHATHETVDELGEPMEIVHRDVSPQNVMVAIDGSARLLDFGVAKAIMAAHVTREGTYKGKLAYSAPEQLRGAATRQSDVYSLSVLLWEMLVGQRMHRTRSGSELVEMVLNGTPPTIREALSADGTWDAISAADRRQLLLLDPIVRKGLAVDMRERWATAADMEEALTASARPATPTAVAAWLKTVGREFLERRDGMIAAEEASFRKVHPVGSGRSSNPAAPLNSSINLRLPRGEASNDQVGWASSARRFPAVWMGLVCTILALLCTILLLAFREPGVPRVTSIAPRIAEPPPRSEEATKRAVAASAVRPSALKPVEAKETSTLAASAEANEPVRRVLEAPDPPRAVARHAVPEPKEKPVRRPRITTPRLAAPEAPVVTPVAAPTGDGPSRAVSECLTPYYFEGEKKIFKPACL